MCLLKGLSCPVCHIWSPVQWLCLGVGAWLQDALHHHRSQQRGHRHRHRPWLGNQCVLAGQTCMLGCSAARRITQHDQGLRADHLWIISDTASAGIRTVQ